MSYCMDQSSKRPASCEAGPTPYQEATEQKVKMVRKMLWFGYEMHYDKPRTRAEEAMDSKRLCLNHVNAWCLSDKSAVRKEMRKMTVEELTKVVSQFNQVYKSFMDKYNKAG